jgi:outer membrane protein OmpA-like peptidoglycan-associated protein
MKKIYIVFILFTINKCYGQNYKFGIEHLLTFNDFISPNSQTKIPPNEMPRGMELSFSRYLTQHLRYKLPIKTGFGKAIGDSVGRTFFGINAHLQLEKRYGQWIPFCSLGVGTQLLSGKWDMGVPIDIGISFMFEEGFSLVIKSNYRQSFVVGRNSLNYGIGLDFRFNPKKEKNKVVILPSKTKDLVQPQEASQIEEFRADDSEQQNNIIITEGGSNQDKNKQLQARSLNNAMMSLENFLAKNKKLPTLLLIEDNFYRRISDLSINRDTIFISNHNLLHKPSLLGDGYNLVETIYFKTNVFLLNKMSSDILQNLLTKLQNSHSILIVGHSDNVGNDFYNLQLSQKRAVTVAHYLIQNGIDSQKISIAYFGEQKPIQTNNSLEGRKLNRRVEIFIIR